MTRLQTLKNNLQDEQLDAIVVLSDYNRRYLSKFSGTSGALVITTSEQYLLTDFRYIEQATNEATEFEIVNQQGNLIDAIVQQLESVNAEKVGFEGDLISYDQFTQLDKGQYTLQSISGLIEKIREVKDEDEIELIQQAADIADEAYEYILTVVKAGMTEQQVKAKLESKMLELGAEGTSFTTIVASGQRGALPHGVASDKAIENGDLVTLDFGAYYKGYASDMTRTFAVGQPDQKLVDIYNIVLEANKKGIEAAKPGITGKALDAVARDYIAEKGYGDAFGHSLGHGIGLDVHEGPAISKNSDATLNVNQCVTIEPGIYVEGLGGVRIEDDILITENGCQRFTKSTKDLIIL
ncbi:M24 family metallopeptidase [Staphylococcus auricularis]|uniref:Peptidase M24 family protein n=1 Tax=Staphylococcus auricularis TaxID=29379 RepID=A0ABX5IHN4_9STAP|nr:aminopeptidase P family protein [Staphylococcus auricularis]MCE5038141.1 aminopeptidase P family protein [Staphylococcus auricularis]MEB6569340.1 aminopeptidase P family protein [Staphylococcus auricularis]PTH19134.1 peptidase M24 family protein [Staphylococcus auricularis]PTH26898.1 peptidase M24 family protein [Staphylococcus auricularis]